MYRRHLKSNFLPRGLLRASLFSSVFLLSTSVSAQEAIAMLDTAPVAAPGIQVSSSVQVTGTAIIETEAVASPPAASEKAQSAPTTAGLEPGTMALIGFGLLALAATRRNAR